jgi:hypothetical protein
MSHERIVGTSNIPAALTVFVILEYDWYCIMWLVKSNKDAGGFFGSKLLQVNLLERKKTYRAAFCPLLG